jgi:hypothetical protein
VAGGALAEDLGDLALEALAVLGGEVVGGEDDDGEGAALSGGAQGTEELEAVHDGHHEVEEDEGGAAAGDLGEGGLTVGGLEDGEAVPVVEDAGSRERVILPSRSGRDRGCR